MKNISKLLFITISAMLLWSCEKDENKIYLEGGTPPVLSSSVSGDLNLSFADADKVALVLDWTNPNYQFTTGVSSQDVSYLVEIDTAGANFTNPKRKQVAVSKDLSQSFLVSQLNDYMLNQMELQVGVEHNLEIRVTANLTNNSAKLSSNVLAFTATPYAIPPKVEPPTDETLWMVGDAAPSGWDNPIKSPYDETQEFTKVSETLYELTVTLPGGGGYKLIQTQGVWSTQYHMLAGGTWEGGDFEKKDSDPQFPGPPTSGTYKITVDFQRGKFTVVKQ